MGWDILPNAINAALSTGPRDPGSFGTTFVGGGVCEEERLILRGAKVGDVVGKYLKIRLFVLTLCSWHRARSKCVSKGSSGSF